MPLFKGSIFLAARFVTGFRLSFRPQTDIKRPRAMTRKSIEATAKYFIWALFVLFLIVVYKVLEMSGIV